jgi:ribosomal protein S18 acetylase RimI-like enzyme
VNDEIEIREPKYKDIKEIERKHFGPLYGEDFAVRNINQLFEYLDFRGAYIGERLVGAYYFYSSDGYTCVDGLIVDEDFRCRHIATTLLKHAVSEASGDVVFLHADQDDYPRKIYEKLGFAEVDKLYEYLSTEK